MRNKWSAATFLMAVAGTTSAASTLGPASPAAELAAAICTGEVTAQDVVTQALTRADGVANLNAFVRVDAPGATEAAKAVDAARAEATLECKPLLGVPMVVKDNINVAGLPTTGGTPALADNVPAEDAPVVARLRQAGAIVIGKTNMHELAFGISGYNPSYNTGPDIGVRNAYDPARSAGGSSSGTGAALGARVVGIGLGTDTGGSLRIPCAFNGCASLRPTVGRYPGGGALPISHTRDTTGPMALAMADVALLDEVITGEERAAAVNLAELRLGLVPEFLENLDADTRVVFNAALDRIRSAGVTVVDVSMPGLMALNAQIGTPLAAYEAHDDVGAYLAQYQPGVSLEQLASQIASPDVRGVYEGLVIPRKLPNADGELVDGKSIYAYAMDDARPALQALYADTFSRERLDALVFPTVPVVAMAANPQSSSPEMFGLVIQNTDPGSNAGIPGVQLPAGLGPETGLPVGLELDGPTGSDRHLISIGLAVEALLGRLPAPASTGG